MTLNSISFREFLGISQISDETTAKRITIDSIISDNVVSTSNWSNFWHAFASRGVSWAFLYDTRQETLIYNAPEATRGAYYFVSDQQLK